MGLPSRKECLEVAATQDFATSAIRCPPNRRRSAEDRWGDGIERADGMLR